MSAIAKTVFRLNGQVLSVGESLAQPAGLTAASWQVLGAVLRQPLSVAGVAREIGLTRQSVQRVANLLVKRRLAKFQPNPAHRRAQLLTATDAGRNAIRGIAPAHAELAKHLKAILGDDEMPKALETLERLTAAFGSLGNSGDAKNLSGRWVVDDVIR